MSQFKKLEQDRRSIGTVRWKHAMHLIRLLVTGAAALRTGRVPVRWRRTAGRCSPSNAANFPGRKWTPGA